MNSNTRKRLEATGARVTTVQEFLDLSEAEMALVEIKIALAKALREQRRSAELTQQEAAKLFGSSQSRVAKMEAGDPTVSMDLLVSALLKLGASTGNVGRVIERARPKLEAGDRRRGRRRLGSLRGLGGR